MNATEAAARALEEAAAEFDAPPNGQAYNGYRVAEILRDRAAEIRRTGTPPLVHGHVETKYVDGWFVASCDCGYVYGGMTRDEADGRLLDHIDRAEGGAR